MAKLLVLTLQRPRVSNGFNIPMCEEILAAIDLTQKNDDVLILQIQAAGLSVLSWWRLS